MSFNPLKHKLFLYSTQLVAPHVALLGEHSVEVLNKNLLKKVTIDHISCLCLLFSQAFILHETASLYFIDRVQNFAQILIQNLFKKQTATYHQEITTQINSLKLQDNALNEKDTPIFISYFLTQLYKNCGVEPNDSFNIFCLLEGEYVQERENLFFDVQSSIDTHIRDKIVLLQNSTVQTLIDTCIDISMAHLGPRFHLIHNHHSSQFYSILEKIRFDFSTHDCSVTQEFLNMVHQAKNNPHNFTSSHNLSYGVLLNEEFIDHVLQNPNLPPEILTYFIHCNEGIGISKERMLAIEERLDIVLCQEMLLQSIEVVELGGFTGNDFSLNDKSEKPQKEIFKI